MQLLQLLEYLLAENGQRKAKRNKTLQLPEMPEKNNAVVTLKKTGHEIIYTTLEELVVKKFYGENELRRMYLEFFESKGHLAMKSFSLVPHNDNSLLIINSGMAPLKPYFTGQEIPPKRRVTTSRSVSELVILRMLVRQRVI